MRSKGTKGFVKWIQETEATQSQCENGTVIIVYSAIQENETQVVWNSKNVGLIWLVYIRPHILKICTEEV